MLIGYQEVFVGKGGLVVDQIVKGSNGLSLTGILQAEAQLSPAGDAVGQQFSNCGFRINF